MAATQQSTEIISSQLTQVAVGDTKPPQSAQKTQIDTTNDLSMARAQNTTQNARDNHFDENNKSSWDVSSFTASLHQYSRKLDHDFDGFQESIEKADPPTESIEDFDWEELENAYQKEVGDIVMRERDIISQFDARFKQFMLWMQVSDERENQRAIKRIKTQSTLVQISECELAKKEQHYTNVMQAFQNAMLLLSHPT